MSTPEPTQRTPFQRRARQQLPSLVLTLLSIVQALALELLWSLVRESDWLFAMTPFAVLGWLQVLAVFIGIVLVWLIYVSNVVRFRWTPGTDDLVLPFIIGVIQFVLIDTNGPNSLGAWFGVQALIFAVMTAITQRILRRARLDGSNDEYFRDITPANLRTFAGPAAMVAVIAGVGLVLGVTGYQGPLAIGAVGLLTLLLIAQMVSQHFYFQRSMSRPDRTASR